MSESVDALAVPESVKQALRKLGYTNLRQIAAAGLKVADLLPTHGEKVVHQAAELLLKTHLRDVVEEGEDQVTLKLDCEADPPLVNAACMALSLYAPSFQVEGAGNSIVVRRLRASDSEWGSFLAVVRAVAEGAAGMDAGARPDEPVVPAMAVKRAAEVVGKYGGFDGIVEALLGAVRGNELCKAAAVLGVVSLSRNYSYRLNSLMVGPPASGKTLIGDILEEALGGLVVRAGANTTRAGLVINMLTGEPGILLQADGKVVVVDEFGAIDQAELEKVLELMWKGETTVMSGQVKGTYRSRFVMFAFTNPRRNLFTGNLDDDLPVEPALANRFAFIAKTEEVPDEEAEDLLYRLIASEGPGGSRMPRDEVTAWLRGAWWVRPSMAEEDARYMAREVLKLYQGWRGRGIARLASRERLALYAGIAAKCLAAAEVRREVERGDVDRVLDMYAAQAEQWLGPG